jgi:methyl-accepting chemotaxis protein
MSLPRSLWPADVVRWSVDTATSVPRRVLDLLSAAETVVVRAGELVDRTEKVIGEAEEAVGDARRVTADAREQLTATRPLVEFMEEFSAHEVRAAIKLVDELPRLSRHLNEDILPILSTLNQVGPDLHDLLEVANDVRQAILGIPGFDFLRRRGEDKDSEISAEEADEGKDR